MASPQTTILAVSSTDYVDVVCRSDYCRRILVEENYNSTNTPTQDFLAQAPMGAEDVRVAKGTPFIFTPQHDGNFTKNTIVGRVKTAAGSISMRQIESWSI